MPVTDHPRSQLRDQPEVIAGEVPGLLERLAQVSDPHDPHVARHAPAVVLTLTACTLVAGATSPRAVGEWIAQAPPQVLDRLGVRPDPVLPQRLVPAETTVCQLFARINGDALDQARALTRPPSVGSEIVPRCGATASPGSFGSRSRAQRMECAVC
ncbi:transposase family protein [Streptomyces sp. NPDC127036]|uniref:transposase family protein n=1 Tax=Streptomyces sp. NPDC127036 TaxID=3347112 RepID=UPI00365BA61B